MIEVQIDKAQIEELRSFFNSTSRELDKASNRAIKKTIAWAQGQVIKQVAKENNIQQKVLKTRARTSMNTSKKEGKLWFGTYRISLIRLNAKQNKSGVKAGTRGAIFVKSAFLAPIENGIFFTHQVFKRNGKFSFPKKGRYAGKGILREELDKQVYDYSASATGIKDKIMPQITAELIKKLRQELNWEASKR